MANPAPKIYISYSPFDADAALSLTEQLRAEGLDVWIDDGSATQLGAHRGAAILEHIDNCTTFVVLLSIDSIESDDILKQLAIAFEQNKSLIPVEIDPVLLPTSFYYLKDLRPIPITDGKAIFHAVEHGLPHISERETRPSLIVLPFQDLSSEENNNWFGDGLTSEIIDALAQIKSLRILDRSSSMQLRDSGLSHAEIGKEFNTRYLIEGSVFKFGDEIDISVSLLDLDTGKSVWRQSHHGEFKDIFGIQEEVAEKVIGALKLHLTAKEQSLLRDRGTQNAEAYELMLKALVYFRRQTKQGFTIARELFSRAIQLDPAFANAYQAQALALASLYRDYDPDRALLEEGLSLVDEALRLKPDLWKAYHPRAVIYKLQGKLKEAEQAANTFVEHAPEDPMSHFALAFFYAGTDQLSKAIVSYERFLTYRRGDIITLWNLVYTCELAGETAKAKYWARIAVPRYEQYLRMFPDSEDTRVGHAQLLFSAGKEAEARAALVRLDAVTDPMCLYNTACLHCALQDYELGMRTMRKAMDVGLRNKGLLKQFLTDGKWGVLKLSGTTEHNEFARAVEVLSND